MSRNLNRIVYDAVLLDKLTNAGLIRVSDYYESSVITLMTKCQLNRVDIEKINQLIADKVAPAPMNALQIQLSHQKSGSEDVLVASSSSGVVSSSGSNQYVSTGSTGLDTLLGGGLSQIGITEVVGSPGMGKTQLCLSCCAAMTLRGKGVVFIDTELKFDPLRLSSLVQSRLSLTVDSDMTSEKVLERVQVHRPTTTIDLTRLLEELESTIITHNVGLVVIDSVAALARHENLVDADRERLVVYWTALLKRVADLCHCCILVTNQVLSLGNYPEDRQSSVLCRDIIFEEASGISFRPALGLAWSHCVDTRLVLLNRSPGPGVADSTNVADVNLSSRYLPTSSTIVGDSVRSGPSTERVICVDKSPARARLHAVYAITAEGITVGPATAST